MADYRDERETLRRRVEELERELDSGDANEELERVREDRDRLRVRVEVLEADDAKDRLENANAQLRRERDAAVSKRDAALDRVQQLELLLGQALAGRTPGAWMVIRSAATIFVGTWAGAVGLLAGLGLYVSAGIVAAIGLVIIGAIYDPTRAKSKPRKRKKR